MARPRLLLLVVLVITACAALLGGGVADRLSSGGSQIPGAESTYTTRVLEQRRPASQPNLLLMVSARGAKDGVDDPQVAAEAPNLARRLGPRAGGRRSRVVLGRQGTGIAGPGQRRGADHRTHRR